MIIDKPCNIHKKKLEIEVSYKDFDTGKISNTYLNPNKLKEDIILTRKSSISTEIFKLKPDLNITIVNHGKPTHTIINLNKLPLILKNEQLFEKLSKYKRKKLAYIFAKSVCIGRIKTLFRLNESRNNEEIKEVLKEMRNIDKKLINFKTINELMAFEGNVAKLFYYGLSLLDDRFDFRRDRFDIGIVNVLLNFSRGILRKRILNRLILKGLNPYHSFLHKNHHSNTSLVFDFSELWLPYTDKLVFYAINKGIIKENQIDNEGRLNKKAIEDMVNLVNRISNKEIDKKIDEFIGYLKKENKFNWKV